MNKIIQIIQDDDIRCVRLSQREFSEFFDIALERDTEFVFCQDTNKVYVYFWYADLDRVADIYFEVCDPIEHPGVQRLSTGYPTGSQLGQSTCILPFHAAVDNTFRIETGCEYSG